MPDELWPIHRLAKVHPSQQMELQVVEDLGTSYAFRWRMHNVQWSGYLLYSGWLGATLTKNEFDEWMTRKLQGRWRDQILATWPRLYEIRPGEWVKAQVTDRTDDQIYFRYAPLSGVDYGEWLGFWTDAADFDTIMAQLGEEWHD